MRRTISATALALIVTPISVGLTTSSHANPAGTGLVITEAYVNGGSAGATYTNKFVEIYNPSAVDVPLTGLSLQYRSPTGTGNAGNVAALTGTVAAHDYYVVQGGSNGANGVTVPGVDQVAAGINPGAAGGTLFVATGTTAINPTTSPVTAAQLVNGKASVVVGPFGTVGSKVIKVAYFGDSHALAGGSADVPVTVVKAKPTGR